MKYQRLIELDALRGLAALAVVFCHYFYRYNGVYGHDEIAADWAYVGRYGVQLFFMISGFVIYWTLSRTQQPFDFIVSRFSRLYPTYWAAVLMTFTIVCIFGLPGREVSIDEALANMLMFHPYLGISNVDGAYWTLTIELTFYFWIFLFYLSSSLGKIEEIFSLLVFLSVLHSVGVITIPASLYEVLILKHLSFFLAGICFYKIVSSGCTAKTVFALTLSLFSTVAIYSFNTFLIFTFLYLLFFLAISGRLKILTFKPLLYLGGISYPLYLLHQNIGYVIINKSYELQLHPLLGIAIALLVSLVLAAIFRAYIEKPALTNIRKRYRKNRDI